MNERLNLIPYPARVDFKGGTLRCDAIKACGKESINGLKISDFFAAYGIRTGDDGVKARFSAEGCDVEGKEAYVLDVSADGIVACANSDAGLFYAAVTLVQLLHNYENDLPLCTVKDSPAVGYRGFMLDCGRYFFCKEDVFKIIDLCALHKINVFHWHLTEDQGWRISIDKYPELTEKGSMRSHTNFGFRPHGGYYTKQDATEISAYCKARNIEIVPEIDVPGHSQAAIACYPWLGCFDRKLKVATHSGVKHDILCAGKESTYTFVFDVIDEIVGLFGDNMRYMHIGGDEAVKTRWKICPHCQKKMKELGLEKEDQLQAHFMQRIADHVVKKGFIPVMWNETDLSLPCHDDIVWQLWTTADGTVQTEEIIGAAFRRGGLINSESTYVYIDLPYADVSLEKSYSFKPIPDGADSSKLCGAETALWTEYVPDFRTACKRALPRLCAIADKMWGGYGGDFGEFLQRLDHTEKFLKKFGYDGATRRQAMPGKVRAFFQKLWFERRQLHWQGLHNLIENAAVNIRYRKKER